MSDTTDILTGPAGQDAEPAAPAAAPAEATSAPVAADAGAPTTDPRPRRRAAGLSGMLLPELQAMATSLGISGVGRMRKGDLVSAIQARQSGTGAPAGDGQGQLPLGGGPVAAAAEPPPAPVTTPVDRGAGGGAPGVDRAAGRRRDRRAGRVTRPSPVPM